MIKTIKGVNDKIHVCMVYVIFMEATLLGHCFIVNIFWKIQCIASIFRAFFGSTVFN